MPERYGVMFYPMMIGMARNMFESDIGQVVFKSIIIPAGLLVVGLYVAVQTIQTDLNRLHDDVKAVQASVNGNAKELVALKINTLTHRHDAEGRVE